MTIFGSLHPKRNEDRIYLSRDEGGRGLIREEEKGLLWYVKNSEEG